MSMTITEKILAHAGKKSRVAPGDNIWVSADILLTHDVCGPGTVGVFKREFGEHAKVWNKEGVVIIPDHYIFTADEMCRRNVDAVRQFAKEQELPYYYDVGTDRYQGVCHVAMIERGHVRPGEVIFGTDSHTCSHGALGAFSTGIGNTDAGFVMGTGKLLIKVPASQLFVLENQLPEGVSAKDIILKIIGDIGVDGATYEAMEFTGDGISSLSLDERMTICNMAVEAGAKNGIIAPDQLVIDFLKTRTDKPYTPFYSDRDASWKKIHRYDLSKMEPVVALPFCPENVKSVRDAAEVKLDRAYIGSCTGGKIDDFMMAAKILNGRKVTIPTFLVPATRDVETALSTLTIGRKTLRAIFAEAGCEEPAPPSCAACLGGPVDTYGRCNHGEICISTTNRNFPGRMGSKDSQTILASPMTAAASAVAGHIADPRDYIQ